MPTPTSRRTEKIVLASRKITKIKNKNQKGNLTYHTIVLHSARGEERFRDCRY